MTPHLRPAAQREAPVREEHGEALHSGHPPAAAIRRPPHHSMPGALQVLTVIQRAGASITGGDRTRRCGGHLLGSLLGFPLRHPGCTRLLRVQGPGYPFRFAQGHSGGCKGLGLRPGRHPQGPVRCPGCALSAGHADVAERAKAGGRGVGPALVQGGAQEHRVHTVPASYSAGEEPEPEAGP